MSPQPGEAPHDPSLADEETEARSPALPGRSWRVRAASALVPGSRGSLTSWKGRCPPALPSEELVSGSSHSPSGLFPASGGPGPVPPTARGPPQPRPARKGCPGAAGVLRHRLARRAHGPCLGSAATKRLLAVRAPAQGSVPPPPHLLPSARWPLALTLSPLSHAPRAKAPCSFWVTFHSRLSPGEAERESGFLEGFEKAPWRGLGPRSESGSVV